MDRVMEGKEPPRKRRVRRYSPDRLLRETLDLPSGVVVSAERHRGRIVVRVEELGEER